MLKYAFLTKLKVLNVGSRAFPKALARGFPDTLTRVLASQEGMNTAMSLQGDDALTLIDQVSWLDDNQNAPLIPPCRLSRLQTWTSTSGESVFASSAEPVA